jgi:hypothetical protein
VDVSTQSDVVSQVPAVVVGIFVNDDVIAVPEPVAAEANVIRSHTEIEAAEPEAVGAASGQMPNVATAEAAGKASVFPGMIKVVVGIVTAGVVSDPFAVGVDVRRVRMSGLVVEVRGCRRRMCNRSRAVRWDVPGTTADIMVLGKGCKGKQAANCQRSDKLFHVCPFFERPEDFTDGRIVRAIWEGSGGLATDR